MSDFKVIETQEQLDEIIKDRIARAEAKAQEKYADYDSLKAQLSEKDEQITALSSQLKESTEKVAGYDGQVKELQNKISAYATDAVKTRVAHEMGLPYELANRLNGSNEEEIKADAKKLKDAAKLFHAPAPLGTPEPVSSGGNTSDNALLSLAHNLTQGE